MMTQITPKECPFRGICASAELCERLETGGQALAAAGLAVLPETSVPVTVKDTIEESAQRGCAIQLAVDLDPFITGVGGEGPNYKEWQIADIAIRHLLRKSGHLLDNPAIAS